MTTKQKLLSHK